MTTKVAEHDFIEIQTVFFGKVRMQIENIGIDWPPPEFIVFDGEEVREAKPDDPKADLFQRHSMSSLTDKQMEGCSGVARGAAYGYVMPLDVDFGRD